MDGDLWNYVVHFCASNSVCQIIMWIIFKIEWPRSLSSFLQAAIPVTLKYKGVLIYYDYNLYKRIFIIYYFILTSGAGMKVFNI